VYGSSYGNTLSLCATGTSCRTNVSDIDDNVTEGWAKGACASRAAGSGSTLLAGSALRATPDSIVESGSVVQVIGLLAGRPIEDSGLVWPNEMVSEGAD
jgi:hypothetical protein